MLMALDESYREASAQLAAEHELLFFDGPSTPREVVANDLRDVEVLAIRRPFPFFVDEELIEQLARVQLVHKSGTSVDGLDVQALSKRGILLASNRGVNASCVAEHVLVLMLLCLRNTYQYLANMRRGVWEQIPPPPGIFELGGKTVGIVGMGAIGCEVAKRVTAFGASILAYQRNPHLELAILAGVQWVSLDDLLRESDVVTLNLPLTTETQGMIGDRELGLMKPTAVLINTARGPVVDERALYEALVGGRLMAAGLDVFEQEPTPADNPLLKLDNVIATPHISGRSHEVRQGQITNTVRDLMSFVAGRRPRYLINPEILRRGSARVGDLR